MQSINAPLDQRPDDADTRLFLTIGSTPFVVEYFDAYGLRFASECLNVDCTQVSESTVRTIGIVAPFAGVDDASSLGVGATRVAFDSAFGPSETVNGVEVYTGEISIGVRYEHDSDCAERARMIILNYIEGVSDELLGP